MLRFSVILLAASFVAASASASTVLPRIVINDDAGADAARALGAPFHSVVELRFYGNSTFTGVFGLCSGSLISPTTVLFAQHCYETGAADRVQVRFTEGDGTLQFARTVSSIQRMPGYTYLTDGTDIAILSLGEEVTDRTPFRVTADFILGEEVRMVGYGLNGIGSEGHQGTRDGQRWAADNVITEWDFGEPYSGPNVLYGSTFLEPDDPDALEFEGTTAGGDSGGPLLVNRNGEWVIAGVLSGGTTATSVYGDISIWTGIYSQEAQQFVRSGGAEFYQPPAVIPLPASGWLLLGALAMAAGLGRRRTA